MQGIGGTQGWEMGPLAGHCGWEQKPGHDVPSQKPGHEVPPPESCKEAIYGRLFWRGGLFDEVM